MRRSTPPPPPLIPVVVDPPPLFEADAFEAYRDRILVQPQEGLRCTSETAHVEVPGLTLREGFVGEEQEEALLRHFVKGDDVRWTGPLRRRVQHYGCATRDSLEVLKPLFFFSSTKSPLVPLPIPVCAILADFWRGDLAGGDGGLTNSLLYVSLYIYPLNHTSRYTVGVAFKWGRSRQAERVLGESA